MRFAAGCRSARLVLHCLRLPHIVDIILSRGPFSDCDSLLSDWRSAAGEQIRKEYLQAMSA